MPATFDEAFELLGDAKDNLQSARETQDPMEKLSRYKMCLITLSQAVQVAHRTYEIRTPLAGSDGGGTRTWAKNELEDFARAVRRISMLRDAAGVPFESMDRDCELWMQRAKTFVNRLAAEAPMVASRVDETRVEWGVRNTGKIVRWEEKDGELIDRTV